MGEEIIKKDEETIVIKTTTIQEQERTKRWLEDEKARLEAEVTRIDDMLALLK